MSLLDDLIGPTDWPYGPLLGDPQPLPEDTTMPEIYQEPAPSLGQAACGTLKPKHLALNDAIITLERSVERLQALIDELRGTDVSDAPAPPALEPTFEDVLNSSPDTLRNLGALLDEKTMLLRDVLF